MNIINNRQNFKKMFSTVLTYISLEPGVISMDN